MNKSSTLQDRQNKIEKNRSQIDHEQSQNTPEEHSLKGTFASVMILGVLMAVSWVGVFLLYLSRN